MSTSLRSSLLLVLLLALALTGCVKPRPSPTALPTKLSLLPTATGTGAELRTPPAAAETATPTPEVTAEPTSAPTEVAPTQTPEPTATPGQTTYVVRWGDTLSGIARQYGTTVAAIVAANPAITNPSLLVAGTVLVIPSVSSGPAAPEAPATPGTYVVQRGDTLSSIARKFGTTVQALLAANPSITNRNVVYAGQMLVIPAAGAPAAPATRTHVVQAGDTLSSLARQYGTTVWAIVQRNNLPNENSIFVGQMLVIP
ncbi:MAG TPA: LysM peptidoglycan-binding domain-containing protein [Anaerolineae bacterium]|nr:LysM peptidoglycan-binding domain-containing protein [Anaerolineae bacterium]HPL26647.1 LysM peptidoglycan-binding domain-containing protein [Anaerolineae bacterium]